MESALYVVMHEYGHLLHGQQSLRSFTSDCWDYSCPFPNSAWGGHYVRYGYHEMMRDCMGERYSLGPVGPWQKIWMGWVTPIEVNESIFNTQIPDLSQSGVVYKIPVSDLEYFLISNHQKQIFWERDWFGKGVMIWHINEGGNQSNVFFKVRDLECADGLWDTTGAWPGLAEPYPETGRDNLDWWGSGRCDTIPGKNANFGDSTDFFCEGNNTFFDHLSNPSSDVYNVYEAYGNIKPQNIASHIAIRNIHRDPDDSTVMRADILVNYVQSDNSIATGPTNGRKLILYEGNLYMVYKSKKYIYFTWQNPNQRWAPAFPIGEGYYPAFSRASSEWCVSWIKDEGEDKVIHFSKGYQYSWSEPTEIYRLSPTQNDNASLSPLSMIVDSDDTVHLVMEAQLSSATFLSWELKYGKFYKDNPSQIVWEILDSYYEPLLSLELSSPSITLDHDNYPHVTWARPYGDNSGEVLYIRKTETGWDSVEVVSNSPSVLSKNPSIDIADGWVHFVWEEDGEIYYRKRRLEFYLWKPIENISNTLTLSRTPVIANGVVIAWSEDSYLETQDISNIVFSIYEGDGWSSPIQLTNNATNSKYPQIVLEESGSGEATLFAVYTKGTESPYEVAYAETSITVHHYLSGPVTQDTTWSGDVYVNGDLTINQGVKLTILPGTKVSVVPRYDDLSSGAHRNLSEIKICGSLISVGTGKAEPELIKFTSDCAEPSTGDWYGIISDRADSIKLKFTEISYSFYGVKLSNSPNNDIPYIIEDCSILGNYFGAGIINSNARIKRNVFQRGSSLLVPKNIYGIYFENSLGIIDSNEISDYWYGIQLINSSPSIRYNTISGTGKIGLKLERNSSPIIDKNVVMGDYTQYSLCANNDCKPDVLENDFTCNTAVGFFFGYSSDATIRNTLLTGFSNIGVLTSESYPDIGKVEDPGNNSIYSESGASYYIFADNTTPIPVYAQYNWWGTDNPDSSWFVGEVIWIPYLTEPPQRGGILSQYTTEIPTIYSLSQNYPNPFTSTTVIMYSLPQKDWVKIQVYDVTGRVVKKFINSIQEPGYYKIKWDGKDNFGRPLGTGVYFYRIKTERLCRSYNIC